MSLPGFTAEVSLYKMSIHYRTRTFAQTEGAIHPSWLPNRIFNCGAQCNRDYQDCIFMGDQFDECLCRNGYSLCRRGCGLPAPPLRPCWPTFIDWTQTSPPDR